ncbi:MAG TPA: hypothetical protein VG754_12210 [Verrucomicrobiae bacterium]|nr:hypothetical protein [Verrucomicrobiae bacterium]
MKTKQKWVWWLISALALGSVAGCATDNDRYQGGPGPGYGYQQGQPGYWNDWNNPGPPYEWQHPSPREQMTP